MKNQIIFKNEEFGQIRTCVVDGETYFVGKDVADALGYINPHKAMRDHVDKEDKLTERIGEDRTSIGVVFSFLIDFKSVWLSFCEISASKMTRHNRWSVK